MARSLVARGLLARGRQARGPLCGKRAKGQERVLCSEDLRSWGDGGEGVAY